MEKKVVKLPKGHFEIDKNLLFLSLKGNDK